MSERTVIVEDPTGGPRMKVHYWGGDGRSPAGVTARIEERDVDGRPYWGESFHIETLGAKHIVSGRRLLRILSDHYAANSPRGAQEKVTP